VKGSRKPAQKAARRFLLERPIPPSWTRKQWQLLAWTIRYHRGPEPATTSSAFAKLSEDQQTNVRALAGVIRLARGLRKCKIEKCNGFRVEKTAATVLLYVPGLVDSAPYAAVLASAKHLLDSYLGKPLIVRPAVTPQLLTLPAPAFHDVPFAAASD
jgi:hypothetical protein